MKKSKDEFDRRVESLLGEREEKLNVRIPESLKRELIAEAKNGGYKSLSTYVLAILIDRKGDK